MMRDSQALSLMLTTDDREREEVERREYAGEKQTV